MHKEGMHVCSEGIQFFVIPRTVAHQAPLSIGSSMQEYWSGLPFPTPADHPNPGIKPAFPTSSVLASGLAQRRTYQLLKK